MPAPGGDGDLVRVHGEGERGGAAGAGKHAQHLGKFGYLGAAAAKRPRDARLDKAGLLQERVVLADETVVLVDFGRTFGELRGETVGDFDDPAGSIDCVLDG